MSESMICDGPQGCGPLLRISIIRVAIAVLVLAGLAHPASAACSGSSPTRTAASASRTDVNDCVTAAVSGDTINVPAGSASWSSAIALPGTKDVTLKGATVVTCSGAEGSVAYACLSTDNTTLTCSNGCFVMDLSRDVRITGFTMTNGTTNELISCSGNPTTSKHFRVDHNNLISTGGWAPIRCKGQLNGVHPQGIWDHNRMVDVALHTNGTLHQFDEGGDNAQNAIWAETTPLGNSEKVVYIEGNFWTAGGNKPNVTDGNYAMRVVIRFNRVDTSGATAFEFHSPQGENRGTQRWEIYHNAITGLDRNDFCFHGIVSIRGGTGVMFNNQAAAPFEPGCNFDMLMDNVRSDWSSSVGGVAPCNGSGPWDQNTSGQQGWHCRDQIGLGRDLTLWDNNPCCGAWNQELKPAYIWGNVKPTNTVLQAEVDPDGRNPVHIQANRDFYAHSTATGSPQTVGVRVGPLASRPAGCTTGVGYWAIDEGEWNGLNGSAPDGRLYKCTSTNTWTLYYSPYPFPHPWTTGTSGPETPAAPSNLRIISAAVLNWLLPGLGVCVFGRSWRRRTGRR